MLSTILGLGSVASFVTDARSPLPYILFGTVVFLVSWMSAYELTYSRDGIRYRSLFGGRRSLAIADVDHARIDIGVFTYTDRFKPTTRLVVEGRDGPALVINLKVFRKDCVEGLIAVLDDAAVLRAAQD
ncbi:MAG TPA: hypothetical protein VGF28_21300 [Thermoanaerobaculia bacterium]